MGLIEINRNPPRRQLALFGLLFFPLFCAMLGGIVLRAGAAPALAWTIWAVGALAIPLGALRPAALRPVWIGTMLLTFPIGFVLSHVLMAIVYYGVLTPVGLLMRAFGRDPMQRRYDRSAASYWVRRSEPADTSRYFRQF